MLSGYNESKLCNRLVNGIWIGLPTIFTHDSLESVKRLGHRKGLQKLERGGVVFDNVDEYIFHLKLSYNSESIREKGNFPTTLI